MIGIVGGIGSGKSAVATAFASLGGFVIDADRVGHALLEQRPARDLVIERFGPAIQAPRAENEDEETATRSIDRRLLGSLVFSDRAALRDLERILHPRMRRAFERAIARTSRRRSAKAVVLDAAVLFEAGWNDLCDRVVFVDCTRETRLEHVSRTRGWNAEKLLAREAAQMPLAEKKGRSDLTVANDADRSALDAAAKVAWKRILASRPQRRSVASTTPCPTPFESPPPSRASRPSGARGKPGSP